MRTQAHAHAHLRLVGLAGGRLGQVQPALGLREHAAGGMRRARHAPKRSKGARTCDMAAKRLTSTRSARGIRRRAAADCAAVAGSAGHHARDCVRQDTERCGGQLPARRRAQAACAHAHHCVGMCGEWRVRHGVSKRRARARMGGAECDASTAAAERANASILEHWPANQEFSPTCGTVHGCRHLEVAGTCL